MTNASVVLTPPETVPRLRARAAVTVQRQLPAVWGAYQIARALSYVRAVDAPYFAEMFTTIARVMPVTEGGPRLVSLFRLARQVIREGVPGDLVECGVALGGTAALLGVASRRSDKRVWLYDTFEGLPPPESVDGSAAPEYVGTFRGTLEDVRAQMASLRVWPSRVRYVQGLFEDTLPKAEVGQIALLHIDGDWYRSVLTCLEQLYDHVAPGGVIVLDDYGYWPGCRLATDEFLASRQVGADLVKVDAARRYFRKPPSP